MKKISIDYPRNCYNDNKRFNYREIGKEFQVYGLGLKHVCICNMEETAIMVMNALELVGNLEDGHYKIDA